MRLTRLKIGIISGISIAVLSGGVAYALMTQDARVSQQSKPVEVAQSQPVSEPVAEPVVEPVTQTVAQPVATPVAEPTPLVVRTFEEIVKDYPNMSTGAPGFPECAGYLKNAFPERFQENNREESIRWVSTTFTNVCTAIDGKTTRQEMKVLRSHWE